MICRSFINKFLVRFMMKLGRPFPLDVILGIGLGLLILILAIKFQGPTLP
jgi:hypothetical protein